MAVHITPYLHASALPGKGQPAGSQAPIHASIHIGDGPKQATNVLAYVERELPAGGIPAYLAARKSGARAFSLWDTPLRDRQVARVVTQSAQGGRATYLVLDPQGQIIGTITRRKAFRGGLRTRWTVSQPGGPEAVGYKGRLFWWAVTWLLSPLIPPLFIGALLQNGDLPRAPRRVKWRAAGRMVMEHKPSASEAVLLHEPGQDPRVGAALAALLESFRGWYNTSWDEHRE